MVGQQVVSVFTHGGCAGAVHGSLAINVREGWALSPASDALVAEAIDFARTANVAKLGCQLPRQSPLLSLLQRHGFTVESEHEVWKLDVDTCVRTRGELTARQLARAPVPVEEISPSNVAAATRLAASLNLISNAPLSIAAPGWPGIEPAFSFVAGDPARPSGVITCRVLNQRLYLEVLARDPALGAKGQAVVSALFRALFIRAQNLGIPDIYCAITPAKAAPVQRLLRRAEGVCVDRQVVLTLDFGRSTS